MGVKIMTIISSVIMVARFLESIKPNGKVATCLGNVIVLATLSLLATRMG